MTPADIEAIANAVFAKIEQAFGGNVRQGIEDKAKDALRELQVLTLPLTRAGGDAGYYQQQINTAYTGALGALHAAGLYHAPEAHAIAQAAVQAHQEAAAIQAELPDNMNGNAYPVRGSEQPHAGQELGMAQNLEEGMPTEGE